jgi:predicted dehydrogenase
VRREKDAAGVVETGQPLAAPYDDPLHFLEAVLSGQVEEGDSLSGLKTNVTVTEILDAARRSAQTGRTIALPLTR